MSAQPIARRVQCFGGPRDGQRYTVTPEILPIGDHGGHYVLASRFCQSRPASRARAEAGMPGAPGYEYYLRWIPEPRDVA